MYHCVHDCTCHCLFVGLFAFACLCSPLFVCVCACVLACLFLFVCLLARLLSCLLGWLVDWLAICSFVR